MTRANRKRVVLAWKQRWNTAEIARHLGLTEPDVDGVIYWYLTNRWLKVKETWEKSYAGC